LHGWRHYTQTSGGQPASITVSAKRDTSVLFATATSQPGIELRGWKKAAGLEFGDTDGGRTRKQVFRRERPNGRPLLLLPADSEHD